MICQGQGFHRLPESLRDLLSWASFFAQKKRNYSHNSDRNYQKYLAPPNKSTNTVTFLVIGVELVQVEELFASVPPLRTQVLQVIQ